MKTPTCKCEYCDKICEKVFKYDCYTNFIKYESLCWKCYMKLMDRDIEWQEREEKYGKKLMTKNNY